MPSLWRISLLTSGALGARWKLPMSRVSYRRTRTLSTRSQKRSSTNQHFGITRTCNHSNHHVSTSA